MNPAMNVLSAGQQIADRYQLDRRIAVGGMGEVWEASDMRLGRSVAVKVLRPELSDDPEFLHRFRIEARTVASLDHTGIAAVHDYGEDEGRNGRRTAYLVMELVRGEPLSTVISRGPIDPEETLRLLEEAGWALQAAHERGFVHRDVKPGNILVRTDGLVKLTDFGIAKAADAVPVTRSGMVMGTAHYIAPEQASGSEAGPAGDVYSLGIVGYECLAGHRPFRAESAVAVAMMQVRDEPPPLPESVPARARALIESVLVKDPKQRYSTGGEFALAVAAIRRGEPLPAPASISGESPVIPARPPTTPTRPRQAVPVASPPAPTDSGSVSGSTSGAAARASEAQTVARQVRSHPQRAVRRAPERAAAPPTQPLRLQPKTSGRTLLLVLFVLLTLAAIAVGAVIYGGLPVDWPLNSAPRDAGAGTVAGWEGVLAGSAVANGPLGPMNITGGAR
jgi:eukaryotic-like serine/threonine-protein kinase